MVQDFVHILCSSEFLEVYPKQSLEGTLSVRGANHHWYGDLGDDDHKDPRLHVCHPLPNRDGSIAADFLTWVYRDSDKETILTKQPLIHCNLRLSVIGLLAISKGHLC